MALLVLASLGIAGGAYLAKKAINAKPGGTRLYLQRKNIQVSHRLGLIDDLQAAAAYDELRKHYSKLVIEKPIVLAKPYAEAKATLHYTGPFRPEMTQKEARLILGVTEAQAKDTRLITKKWRKMMLKNHPDTGGSPFMAAKINEAKEIVLGEKPAKEGDDDEDGSKPLDQHFDETDDEREARLKKEAKEEFERYKVPDPQDEGHQDDYSQADNPAPPFFTWREPKIDDMPESRPSPRGQWNLKEDTYHRKATRSKPHWLPVDDPKIVPDEDWKLEYLREMKEIDRRKKLAEKFTHTWEPDEPTIYGPTGTVVDGDGNEVDPNDYTEHQELKVLRQEGAEQKLDKFRAKLEHELRMKKIREMAKSQASARRAAERAKKRQSKENI